MNSSESGPAPFMGTPSWKSWKVVGTIMACGAKRRPAVQGEVGNLQFRGRPKRALPLAASVLSGTEASLRGWAVRVPIQLAASPPPRRSRRCTFDGVDAVAPSRPSTKRKPLDACHGMLRSTIMPSAVQERSSLLDAK